MAAGSEMMLRVVEPHIDVLGHRSHVLDNGRVTCGGVQFKQLQLSESDL